MKRVMILATALVVVVGCSIQRAQQASEAQRSMPGMTKADVLACMGAPSSQAASGSTEVWSYPSGGSTRSFGTAQTYASGAGTYGGGTYTGSGSTTTFGFGSAVSRYCVVSVVFQGDTLSAVKYSGRTGGLLTWN